MKEMIKELDDDTTKLMEKENLSHLGKAKFRISELFFQFISFIKEQNIGVRMESLIENLIEYRKSNYTQQIKKIKAAKKLSEIQKDIQA